MASPICTWVRMSRARSGFRLGAPEAKSTITRRVQVTWAVHSWSIAWWNATTFAVLVPCGLAAAVWAVAVSASVAASVIVRTFFIALLLHRALRSDRSGVGRRTVLTREGVRTHAPARIDSRRATSAVERRGVT